jgi:hypothetical protein
MRPAAKRLSLFIGDTGGVRYITGVIFWRHTLLKIGTSRVQPFLFSSQSAYQVASNNSERSG